MNYKRLLVSAIAVLMANLPVAAFEWRCDPYVGVDSQWRRADFKSGFGDNIFAHTYPQANVYLGFKFHENVGVELGYEFGKSRARITSLTTGDVSAGTPISSIISPATFRSKGKFQGSHLNLVGYYAPCVDSVQL